MHVCVVHQDAALLLASLMWSQYQRHYDAHHTKSGNGSAILIILSSQGTATNRNHNMSRMSHSHFRMPSMLQLHVANMQQTVQCVMYVTATQTHHTISVHENTNMPTVGNTTKRTHRCLTNNITNNRCTSHTTHNTPHNTNYKSTTARTGRTTHHQHTNSSETMHHKYSGDNTCIGQTHADSRIQRWTLRSNANDSL